jgi:uncharacterized protein (TIGR00304 family)
MNRYHLLSLGFFIAGIVLFTLGIVSGEVETGFVVIFPFLIGTGIYALVGFLLFFIAMLLFMFGFMEGAMEKTESMNKTLEPIKAKPTDLKEEKRTWIKGGGVILIGPIPIVFGSNWKIALILLLLAVVIMLFLLLILNLAFTK